MQELTQARNHAGKTAAERPLPVVNAHNGWSLLEEAIVGRPLHVAYDGDISFRLFFSEALRSRANRSERGPWEIAADSDAEQRLRAELEEDTEAFVALLEDEGVRVRRPEPLHEPVTIRTPDWTTEMGHSLMPRDMFLVVGNELIETAPLVRSRYFEAHLYKSLFMEYFAAGAKWTVAPRSKLLEHNFDFSHALALGYADEVPANPAYEIMFDGAQVLRLGRDLLFNCATENHRLGMRWLERQVGPDYHVHEINVSGNHIDARVLALRPGTLLVHEEIRLEQLPPFLREWEMVRYSPAGKDLEPGAYGGRPVLASMGLGMNVLSIDEERVVVQQGQSGLIRDLERAGFTPLPSPWRHGRMVGGGFHCMTLDVRRRSVLESYF